MKYPFTISIDGGPLQNVRELRLGVQSLELQNLQPDTVSLQWTRRRPTSLCPLPDGALVDLYLGPRRVFWGRAKQRPVSTYEVDILLEGPWARFDARYCQVDAVDGDYLNTPNDDLYTARFPLFAPSPPFVSLPIHIQIAFILNYLNLVAPNEVLPASQFSGGAIVAGVLDFGIYGSTPRGVQDLRISEAIRSTLNAKPDIACWFDYAAAETGPAAIAMREAGREEPRILRVGRDDGLMRHNLDLLPELAPSAVLLCWETAANALTGRGTRVVVDRAPAIPQPDTFQENIVLQTFSPATTSLLGLAQVLYNSLSVPRSTGTIQVWDPDFARGFRPGMVIQIQGDADLDRVPCQHWVQSVSWSPRTGQTTLTVGYPRHLGIQEYLDISRFVRRILTGGGYL